MAQGLRKGRLQNFRVDIQAVNGEVQLTGLVSDWTQRDEALRLAAAVPGVVRVRDRLDVGVFAREDRVAQRLAHRWRNRARIAIGTLEGAAASAYR